LCFDEVTRGEALMPIKNCTLVKPYPLILLATENDGAPDTMLEKEQGNEYFKKKRYAEAIDLPQKTAYEFEDTWKIFSGDLSAQTELLKIIAPTSLPKIFKDALSAPLLMDTIRCVEHFFMENADFAVQFLENLTKIGTFDMTIMCFSTKDKATLRQMWDEVFVNKRVPVDLQEALIVVVNGVKGKQCILQKAFSHEH
jgi:hypothetical protein